VGEPQPWTVGEAIRLGWETYKGSWAPLTLGYFVVTLIGMIPGQIAPVLSTAGVLEPKSITYYALHAPLSIFGWLLAEFFTAGFTRAALNATRTGHASFGDFFGAASRYLSFVVASMLRSLATMVGLLFLIVPGIIVSLGLVNAPYYVIDQNLGPIEALKASWRSTDGQKGELFVLSLAEFGIIVAGLLAGCLGLFVAVPVMMIARAIVYTRMSGTAAPATGPVSYGPGMGYPPPGYAPGPPGYVPPGYGPPPGGFGGPR
jgi:hypothetical protein